jgi:hypothetical protein
MKIYHEHSKDIFDDLEKKWDFYRDKILINRRYLNLIIIFFDFLKNADTLRTRTSKEKR